MGRSKMSTTIPARSDAADRPQPGAHPDAPADKPKPGRVSEARRDLLRYLFWLFARAPESVSRLHIRGIALLLRLLYAAPRNPVRESCHQVSELAAELGVRHDARKVYRRFVTQIECAANGYLELMRRGPEAALGRVDLPEEATRTIRDLLDRHGGLLITVPHNVGGFLTSVRLAREIPTRVLARNSTSERRDRLMMEFFERLQIDVYLTRSTHVAGLFRACVSALRGGRVVVATLDNIDPGRKSRLLLPVFGLEIPLPTWGARMAVRAPAPVLPAWVTMIDGFFRLQLGEPIHDAPVDRIIRHYLAYFERRILEDPASWLFLGHKRWCRALREAVALRAGR
jgi:lauroyl/myristoyl acyltransferase